MILQPRFMQIGAGAIGSVTRALEIARVRNPLVVTDQWIHQNTDFVKRASASVKIDVFDRVIPDPTSDSVQDLVQFLVKGKYDGIVAIGGGSSIDTAKAAAVLAVQGGKMRDYKVPRVVDGEALPVIAVPTTAGTGSEVTKFTVVTDSESQEKMLCTGSAFVPHTALVDFELTMAKPWRLTADTAIDSLTHAIESFVSKKRNGFTVPLSLAAMTAISQNVITACENPQDRFARASLMLAATQAGIAFSNASVALVHGMSRPIGAHFHIPHGLSNAMLLPKVTEWSISGAPELYAEVAFATGAVSDDVEDVENACKQLVTGLQLLNRKLKVPSFKEYGIEEGKFKSMIPIMAEQAVASGSHLNNPRVPTVDEIEDLYTAIYDEEPLEDADF
jgi:alcohol dehydrogenase class IV